MQCYLLYHFHLLKIKDINVAFSFIICILLDVVTIVVVVRNLRTEFERRAVDILHEVGSRALKVLYHYINDHTVGELI